MKRKVDPQVNDSHCYVRRKLSISTSAPSSNSSKPSVSVAYSTDAQALEGESNPTLVSSSSELSESSPEPSDVSSTDEDEDEDEDETSEDEVEPEEPDQPDEEADVDAESKIINLRPGTKPSIGLKLAEENAAGRLLLSRLKEFIPKMQAANDELEKERHAGVLGKRCLENIDDENEQIIEMNLGLGVLEETTSGVAYCDHDDEDDECSVESQDMGTKLESGKGILDELLRRPEARLGSEIEVVGDG